MKQSTSGMNTGKTPGKKKLTSDGYPPYHNDPFFVKKAEEAKKFVERVGIPEVFLKKK
jgi:hypothetical protein